MQRMQIDPKLWPDLNRLLDTALDLPAAERESWLATLDARYDVLKPQLQQLLARVAQVETRDFLDTLPKVGSGEIAVGGDAPHSCVGPYRLVRELGAGGMGSVWLAERVDGLLRRPVALKLPHFASSRVGLAERMAREREILAALTHPNIARLYDAGVTPEGRPYLALEYIEGDPIHRYCSERRLDVRARLGLFLQVATAVAYAHAKLIIHRDLKPANILVTNDGEARLLDFGVAKLLDEGEARATQLTELSGRALTPDYASPEQILGLPLTIATDVYSLGVVLYELLADARPYALARESRGALEEAILHADPVRPSEAAPRDTRKALRGDLDTIVLRALAKNPEDRYATVNAFAEDVRRYLEQRPILARPDSFWYRVGRLIARRKLATALIATTLLAIAVGAAVAIWQMLEARAQRDAAFAQQRRAEAFSEFMSLLLQDAGSRPQTAPELLKRGAQMLERQTGMDELLLAHMYYEISRNYVFFNDVDGELALLERSIELARRKQDPDLQAAAECSAAWAVSLRDREGGERRLEQALATLARAQPASLHTVADCQRARARLLHARGESEAAIAAVKEGIAAFDRQGVSAWARRSLLQTQLTEIYRSQDRYKDALPISAEELRFVRASGRTGTMVEIVAMNNHAGNLTRVGELAASTMLLEEVLQRIEASEHLAVQPVGLRSNLGTNKWRLGDAARALELADADYALAADVGNQPSMALSDLLAARALLSLGRLDDSRVRIERAEAFWRKEPKMFARMLREADLHRVELLAADNQIEAARAAIDAVLSDAGYPDNQKIPGVDRLLRSAARIYRESGQPDVAARFADEAYAYSRQLAREETSSADVGLAALLRAQARADLGRVSEAIADARLAVDALRNGYGEAHRDVGAAQALLAALQARPGAATAPAGNQ
jgi:serine/threonine-protein kinase